MYTSSLKLGSPCQRRAAWSARNSTCLTTAAWTFCRLACPGAHAWTALPSFQQDQPSLLLRRPARQYLEREISGQAQSQSRFIQTLTTTTTAQEAGRPTEFRRSPRKRVEGPVYRNLGVVLEDSFFGSNNTICTYTVSLPSSPGNSTDNFE